MYISIKHLSVKLKTIEIQGEAIVYNVQNFFLKGGIDAINSRGNKSGMLTRLRVQ